MITIVIIGAGNVARQLYRVLDMYEGSTVVQCYNRKGIPLAAEQPRDHIVTSPTAIIKADLYILAVSDDAIGSVCNTLPFSDALIVHTSGSVPMDVIGTTDRKGVFYPLQTFSATKTVDFSTVPLCIEASNESDAILLTELASGISKKVYRISSAQRNTLHVAAVFVNNFTNHLYTMAHEICMKDAIPFDILYPLIQETVTKLQTMPPADAQTGPAVRNDTETIHRHLETLCDTTSHSDIYTIMTALIQEKYGKKL